MITGVAVAGFGAGALVTAPIAQRLIASVGVSSTFVILGIAYFAMIMLAATVMTNPPQGYAPAGFQPSSVRGSAARDFTLRQALGAEDWRRFFSVTRIPGDLDRPDQFLFGLTARQLLIVAPAFAVIALLAWLMTTVIQLPLAVTMPILAILSGLAISTTLIKADGLSPDERTVYVADTETSRLFAIDIVEPGVLRKEPFPAPYTGRLVCGLPGFQRFDSLAVEASGNIAVATLITGHITVVSPNGNVVRQVKMPDVYPTNICFGGADLRTAYITLSASGQLAAMEWPEPGLRLNFMA